MKRKLHMTPCFGLDDCSSTFRGIMYEGGGKSVWPEKMEDILAQSFSDFGRVQIKECKFYNVGSLLSFLFTLSNGKVAPYAGESGRHKTSGTISISPNTIRKILIQASSNWVNHIKFCDAKGDLLCEMKAQSGVGTWNEIPLEEGETIVGFQEWHDYQGYIRRLGFVTLKP